MFCVLLLPSFRLHAVLRHRPEGWREPVAVLAGEPPLVLEATRPARRAGVVPGLPPSQALAREPGLRLLPREPEAEAALHAILCEAALGATPTVEATAENLLTLDLRQSRSRDWAAVGAALLARLHPLGVHARAGFAENPDLARLAAHATRGAEPCRVVADSAAFLAPLPIEALEPSGAALSILHGWGVHTLEALTRLPAAAVADRLGVEGSHLLERAQGRVERPLTPLRPVERYTEAQDCEYELENAQPLLFLLRRFTEQLALRLENAGRAAGQMRLALPLAGGGCHERAFPLPSPTSDAATLFRVLETYFETLRLEQAPTGLRLECLPALPVRRQHALFEQRLRDPHRFAETLARIEAVVGEGRVGMPAPADTHRPDAYTLQPPDFETPPPPSTASRRIGLPLRRYRPAHPATVLSEGGKPCFVEAGPARGEVAACDGPYRLSGGWWEGGWHTEEWDVELRGGGLYRLSRQGEAWQLEGCYDG